MGLSSSRSRTTTNQNTTQNETNSGTQTPITPPWLTEAAEDYVGRIGAFGEMDPNSFVAPASPLQQMAWQNAGALSGWQGQARTAAEMAQAVGARSPNLAPPSQRYDAPQLGPAALVAGQGYAMPNLDHARGYAAPRVGQPIRAQAPQAIDAMGQYQSPYTQQVVNAALAEFDQGTAQQQARLAAQGARSGAFGGSRFGIAEGQLAADAARGRASTAANLLDQGFTRAAGLAAGDADRGSAVNMFNAGEGNRASLAQAGLDSDAARFGAEANNQFAVTRAGMEQRANEFNTDAANRAGLVNQDAQNRFALARAGLDADAGQFNASADNRRAQFNAQQGDAAAQRALQAAALLQSGASAFAGDTRADLQTLAGLGDQQRAVEQAYALAPLAQLEAIGQLSGMTPYDILVGRAIQGTSSGTGTLSGTSVTRSSPSLFSQLMDGLTVASRFIPGL